MLVNLCGLVRPTSYTNDFSFIAQSYLSHPAIGHTPMIPQVLWNKLQTYSRWYNQLWTFPIRPASQQADPTPYVHPNPMPRPVTLTAVHDRHRFSAPKCAPGKRLWRALLIWNVFARSVFGKFYNRQFCHNFVQDSLRLASAQMLQ